MKKNYSIIKTMVVLMCLLAGKIGAQCTNASAFGTAVAPAQGNSVTITTCVYAGEYSTITGVVSGNTYSSTSSIAGDIVTIHSGTPAGPVVAFGVTPLTWTATVAGTHYAHINTAGCGSNSTCRTAVIGCLPAPSCTYTPNFGTGTAISNGSSTITTCMYAGEHTSITFTLAGNYTLTSTGGTGNYVTLTNSLNVVLASGLSPLAVTIPSTALYYAHVSTNAACGTESACHTMITTGAIPAPPANDLCANAASVAVPGTYTGTTINSTLETPAVPACITSAPTQPGVWYTLTGNGNKFGVDLCATAWDSKVWVFTGACGAVACVTGNDDNGPLCTGASASATWCSVPGVQYRILVAGFSSASAFTLNVTQTVVTTPVISASQNPICAGGASTLTGSGLSTYTWNPGALTGSVQGFSPSSTTIYTLSGNESVTGCLTSAVSELTVNPLPTITVNSASICSPASATLTASGATTYSWSSGGSAATEVVSPTSTSVYTVTGTSLGCSSTATTNVTVSPTPTVSVTGNNAICSSESTTLTASGATSYSWSSGGSAATEVVTPASTAVYTVTGVSGPCSSNQTYTVTVTTTPTVAITGSLTICSGQPANLTAGGATTYTWNTSANTATIAPTPSVNTTYTVVGANGTCTNSATASVSVNATPAVSAASSASLICAGQTATLTASGASTYSWNTSATTTVIAVSPTVTTVYTVIGSTNGCSGTFTISQAVSPCTGINANTASVNGVLVYPNPNTGVFTIELNNGSVKNIEVMDLTGRVILSSSSVNDKVDFNISTLANGIYYVKIQSNNTVEVIKIIKE